MNTKRQPDSQSGPPRAGQPTASSSSVSPPGGRPVVTPGVRPAGAPQPSAAQRPVHPQLSPRRPDTPPPTATGEFQPPGTRQGRLFSLDAFRGIVMIVLAGSGFGILQLTQLPPEAPVWKVLDYEMWQGIGFNFEHTAWQSNFDSDYFPRICTSFWDLIQPAFMFIVGVALPFSCGRRAAAGEGFFSRSLHALLRALVLIVLGVFLVSTGALQTKWEFVNVLAQIGLGYFFVYLLVGRWFWLQLLALVLILVGYWGWFASYTPPASTDFAAVGATPDTVFAGRFASWSKNVNVAHYFDLWLLNALPRHIHDPFEYNEGGYQTLNFVPAMGTMLLGVFCGQLLMSDRRWWSKLFWLVIGGGICLGLGVLAGEYACPIVKRIWTPSWVLFSGGWVIWGLAICYFLCDLCRLRWLAWPLVVVGMNSLAVYLMGQLLVPWAAETVQIHFGGVLVHFLGTDFLGDGMFGRLVIPISALALFWLIALWMYRQKFFVRV